MKTQTSLEFCFYFLNTISASKCQLIIKKTGNELLSVRLPHTKVKGQLLVFCTTALYFKFRTFRPIHNANIKLSTRQKFLKSANIVINRF